MNVYTAILLTKRDNKEVFGCTVYADSTTSLASVVEELEKHYRCKMNGEFNPYGAKLIDVKLMDDNVALQIPTNHY